MKRNIKIKRVISLLLVVIMSMSMLVACGGGDADASKDNDKPSQEETKAPDKTEAPTEEEKPLGEQLADDHTGFVETPMDLDGRTIRFVTTAASRYTYKENKDETANETVEIIEALKTIEDDYNCTIEVEQLKGRDLVEALITSKASGQAYGDILEFGCSDTYLEEIYSGNLVKPLEDEDIADIIKLDSNPWLPASDFGKMFGHQYGVHFKTNNSGDLLRGVILFNKDLAEKYDLGDIYGLVDSKDWNFDKLNEISANIISQSDGSVYPLLYNQEGIFLPMLIYANGGTTAEYTNKGYEFTALSDNTLEALNYSVDMKNNGYIHPSSENRKEAETIFANGEAVFFATNYASLKKYTQGTVPMEDNVGLLPAPLGPNGTDYNAVSYTEAMFHVVQDAEKAEEVAAVLVAIANRTGKRDMMETELMNTLQDEESAEILDLMYKNMVFDLSRSISTSRGMMGGANKEIMNLEKTPKEAYEEIATSVQTIYDELTLVE